MRISALVLLAVALLVASPGLAVSPAPHAQPSPMVAPGGTVQAAAPPVTSTQTSNNYTNWSHFTTSVPYTESATQPPPGYGMASAFDAADGYVVAFGGCTDNYGNCPMGYGSYGQETWILYHNRWVDITQNAMKCSTGPPGYGEGTYPDPRAFAGMAYDPEALPPPPGVSPIYNSNGQLTNGEGAVVMYGGLWGPSILGGHDTADASPADAVTWFFHAGCWNADPTTPFFSTLTPPPPCPPIVPGQNPTGCALRYIESPDWLYGETLTYDAAADELVMVGGDQAIPTNSTDYSVPSCSRCVSTTYTWGGPIHGIGDNWVQGPSGPDARAFASATYDAGDKQVLLYGGVGVAPPPSLSSTTEVTPSCPSGHCTSATVSEDTAFTLWNNYTGGTGKYYCPSSPDSCYAVKLSGLPTLPSATLSQSMGLIVMNETQGGVTYCQPVTPEILNSDAHQTDLNSRVAIDWDGGATGGVPPYSYWWVWGNGNGVQEATGQDITGSIGKATFLSIQGAPLTLTVTDDCGDSGTVTLKNWPGGNLVGVGSPSGNSTYSISAHVDPYVGDTSASRTLYMTVAGGSPDYEYSWDWGDGTTGQSGQVCFGGGCVPDSKSNYATTHTYSKAGTYLVTACVSDSGGSKVCISPGLFVNVTSSVECYTSKMTGGVAPYGPSWLFDYGGVGSGTNPASSSSGNVCVSISPTSYGPHTQLFQAIDANGNVYSGTITTTVADVAARGTVAISSRSGTNGGYAGSSAIFDADLKGPVSGGSEYWDFGDGTIISTGPNQQSESHIFSQPGTYTVTVSVNIPTTNEWSQASLVYTVLPANLFAKQLSCSVFANTLVVFQPTITCVAFVPGTFSISVTVFDIYSGASSTNSVTVTSTPPAGECSGAGFCSPVSILGFTASPGACLYGCSATQVTFTVYASFTIDVPAGCSGATCTILTTTVDPTDFTVYWNAPGGLSQGPVWPGCTGTNTSALTCNVPAADGAYPVTATVTNNKYLAQASLVWQFTPGTSGPSIVIGGEDAAPVPIAPRSPASPAMTPDNIGNQCLFATQPPGVACEEQDLWAFTGDAVNGGGTWAQLTPSNINATNFPPAEAGAAMVYDPQSNSTILYGGITALAQPGAPPGGATETWVFKHGAWTLIKNIPTAYSCAYVTCTWPDVRGYALNVYDPTDGVMVLFGGTENTCTTQCTWPQDLASLVQYGDGWGYDAVNNTWVPDIGARIAGVDRYTACPIENAQGPSMTLTFISTNDSILFQEHDICYAHLNVGDLLWDYANNSVGIGGYFGQGTAGNALIATDPAVFALNYQADIGQLRFYDSISGTPSNLYQNGAGIAPVLVFTSQYAIPSTASSQKSGVSPSKLAGANWAKQTNYTVLGTSWLPSVGSSYNSSTFDWEFNVTDPGGTTYNWWSQGRFLFFGPSSPPVGPGGGGSTQSYDIWVDMAEAFIPSGAAFALIEWYFAPGTGTKRKRRPT